MVDVTITDSEIKTQLLKYLFEKVKGELSIQLLALLHKKKGEDFDTFSDRQIVTLRSSLKKSEDDPEITDKIWHQVRTFFLENGWNVYDERETQTPIHRVNAKKPEDTSVSLNWCLSREI